MSDRQITVLALTLLGVLAFTAALVWGVGVIVGMSLGTLSVAVSKELQR